MMANGCIFTSPVLEGEKARTKEKNDCCKLYLSSTVCSLDWADGLHLYLVNYFWSMNLNKTLEYFNYKSAWFAK